jgi:hypothetical protein
LNTEHTSPFDFLCALPIRPRIRATPAASLAGKPRLDVRQPNIIRPSVAADRSPMAAMIVGTVDEQTAHPGGAHLGERDFPANWLGHGPMTTPIGRTVKPLEVGPSPRGHTRRAVRPWDALCDGRYSGSPYGK